MVDFRAGAGEKQNEPGIGARKDVLKEKREHVKRSQKPT